MVKLKVGHTILPRQSTLLTGVEELGDTDATDRVGRGARGPAPHPPHHTTDTARTGIRFRPDLSILNLQLEASVRKGQTSLCLSFLCLTGGMLVFTGV